MKIAQGIFIFLPLLLGSLGCTVLARPSPTPAPLLADSFFFGRAYVDANGNEKVDPDDPPLEGARFSAQDSRGANGGGQTDKDGYATAWWPGDAAYPVTLRMQPPEGSGYRRVGSEEIVLKAGVRSEFLFSLPDAPGKP